MQPGSSERSFKRIEAARQQASDKARQNIAGPCGCQPGNLTLAQRDGQFRPAIRCGDDRDRPLQQHRATGYFGGFPSRINF